MRILGTRTAAISQGSRARSYQSGRTCGHGDCATILSVYNPSRYCSVHEKPAFAGRKRRMPLPPREVACEHCATVFETANRHRKYCGDHCRMAAFARRKRAAIRAGVRRQKALPRPVTSAAEPEKRELVAEVA